MSDRAMRLRIGLFVLVALALLAGLVILFSAMPSIFKGGKTYVIRFPDAPGVSQGTPVRRSGVRVGEVHGVELEEATGQVLITITVNPSYEVRHNDVPTLTAGLFGSDTTIDFLPRAQPPGQPPLDRSPVPPGEEIAGVRGATVSTLLREASGVVPSTQEALNDVRKSLQRIEKLTPLVEETLRVYRDLGKSVNDSVPDLRKTNTEALELLRSMRETMPEARKTVHDLDAAIPTARRTMDDIAAASRSINKLSERADVLLQSNQDKIVKSIEDLNEVLHRAAMLMNDENIRAINSTIRNTSRASDRLPEIATQVEAAAREGAETMKEAQRVVQRSDGTLNRVDDVLKNLQEITRPLAERSTSIFRNLDEATQRVNRSLGDVGELFRVLDQSDGTVRKLLTDPSLFNHLDQIVCQLAHSMPRVEQILKDVGTFADELARHPESIGLGGVVRPSTGLKNPPTPPGTWQH